LHLEELLRIL